MKCFICLFNFTIFMLFSSNSHSNEINKSPRIGVACIVQRDGKILLGQRKGSHAEGCWGFPGGHLEFGESVEECASRELLEETGLKSISLHLGPWVENLMENNQKHYITIFVFIDEFSGNPHLLEPDKCLEWKWFDLGSFPEPLFSPIYSLIAKQPNAFRKNILTKK